jgi:anti-anti-sigma factor
MTSRPPLLEISERQDADGALRLTLIGEMDFAVTDRLQARLDQLRPSQRRVRLDLSQLEFIDCSGIRAILNALAESRRDARELEVGRTVSTPVERVISLADVAPDLWPERPVRSRPADASGASGASDAAAA